MLWHQSILTEFGGLKGKKVKQSQTKSNKVKEMMAESPDNQVSFTDPDARSMSTSGRGSATVGYNLQSAVYEALFPID